ncbi:MULTISPECIES: hypothetical protein [unclassified Streptomyces]|uniref:hypothetical protein n=1 Tax=unclassified Streptomyces TaxID=2593676 RepID=UPI00036997AF|nr:MULTISPECIES: hypothetical protein [unclassified Streptomyces]MYT33701.1 hypothetical protein [Streptomyces sp. SID8354]
MTTSADHSTDPTRHPELLAWLSERQQAFTQWAQQAGVDRLDFSPGSLNVLEELLRESFASDEEIRAQRLEPFVQGAVWYLGEVVCRAKGMVWKYERDVDAPDTATMPPLFGPSAPTGVLDTPCVSFAEDGPERGLYPLNVLCRTLITEDELGEPVDERLVDALADDYLDVALDEDAY